MATDPPPVIDLQPTKVTDGSTVYEVPVPNNAISGAIVGAAVGATLAAVVGYFVPKIFDRYFEGRDNSSLEWDDEYD